jgi:hypothetical protein
LASVRRFGCHHFADALRTTIAPGRVEAVRPGQPAASDSSGRAFWERLLIPLCGIGHRRDVPAADDQLQRSFRSSPSPTGSSCSFADALLNAMGGHAAVRHTLSEDVAMGAPAQAPWISPHAWPSGSDFAFDAHVLNSLGAIGRGWARNFFSASLGRPWRILGSDSCARSCRATRAISR